MITNWKTFLDNQKSEAFFKTLENFVLQDSKTHTIYPKHKDIFNAFKYTPLDKVRVVLLGQDCYINEGQAMGLAFSVPRGVTVPPSLRNIFKELRSDLCIEPPDHGDLTAWARRGMLLLNSVLTVREGTSASHAGMGWETLTDRAISLLNEQDRSIVFILLGGYAKKKSYLIDNPKHFVLHAAHPSPLSAHNGFFGSRVFSRTNAFLQENDIAPIDWTL
jgi:uracil-DNA glycosylase